ncbi:hypothetical protein B9Q04_01065 [Candidatus Marsarchaeota G2 archaeon BE_D]|jgi:hypothetical protein|uniref:Uncharacterized protein n=1 Tax=Candidatus Marsarchaeota G2 archaeon BE_D TaxID=1978158 RepID=A0A2R6CEG4_9ARCH|nr:MAG: hypothetical protein B9Q04_01065 [Candidatus Marsarchaeota G2 archaeon BE_D]
MKRVSVSVPVPLLGDPTLFPSEPFIIAAGKELTVVCDEGLQSIQDLYNRIVETNKLRQSNLSQEQKECLYLAAALKIKYGEGISSTLVSKELKPILGRMWQLTLPLVYASYTGYCIAAKKSEDPVIVFKRRLLKVHDEYIELSGLKKTGLSSYVTDVVSHAVGRLSVEAAEALRKRNTSALAAVLNCFSGLLFALFEWDENLLKLNQYITYTHKNGYKGCAYIPSWKILVKL